MRIKVKYIIAALFAIVSSATALGVERNISDTEYRRSSLYSFMISYSGQKFNDEIVDVFGQIPIPDKYNDHDLSVKVLNVANTKQMAPAKNKAGEPKSGAPILDKYLADNLIASRLVSKWFMRNIYTGEMSMDLVQQRGLYDASEMAKAKAALSVRGNALLEDAGEDLIQNTFVMVSYITYIDKEQRAQIWSAALQIAAAAASVGGSDLGKGISNLANSAASITETIKGFKVKIHTYLYQLVWDEETAAMTYQNWGNWEAFERNRHKYKLRYVGDFSSSGSTTSCLGIREDQPQVMIRKACQRAIDENIMNLQKNFSVFQVKTPLISVDPIEAQIGKKEGVDETSRFEVLEPVKDENGKVSYRKVGVVKPVRNLIWDNRYMAQEEMAAGATLGYTTFEKVSGGDFFPGFLIKQVGKDKQVDGAVIAGTERPYVDRQRKMSADEPKEEEVKAETPKKQTTQAKQKKQETKSNAKTEASEPKAESKPKIESQPKIEAKQETSTAPSETPSNNQSQIIETAPAEPQARENRSEETAPSNKKERASIDWTPKREFETFQSGIGIGFNASRMPMTSYERYVGPTFAWKANVNFSPYFYLATGLGMSLKGVHLTNIGRVNRLFLQIPINAGARYMFNEKLGVYTELGMYIGIGTVSSKIGMYDVSQYYDNYGYRLFDYSGVSRMDNGFDMKFGCLLNNFRFELGGEFGGTPLFNDIMTSKTRSFVWGAAYMF